MTISFEALDGETVESLMTRLQKDGLSAYMLQSSNVYTVNVRVNPGITMTDEKVTANNQDYIPGNNNSNSSYYKMHADGNGIYMYLPSDQSNGQGMVKLTEMTWEQLGLDDSRFKDGDGINPDSNVSQGEKLRTYTYSDPLSGFDISFTIDSEVSKSELIAAVNNWSIGVTTNSKMEFSLTPTGTITMGSHSASLDAYGTQYDMGRVMPQQMTLAVSQPITHDSAADYLSFGMTDANGKVYDFATAGNVTSRIESRVQSAMNSYISSYMTYYRRYLEGGTRPTANPISTRSEEFSSGSYWVDMNYQMNFSGWLDDSMFDTSYTTDIYGTKHYTVTLKSGEQAKLNEKAKQEAANIINAFTGKEISIKTDAGPVTATTSISSPTTAANKRYSSNGISGNRELKIQSGCIGGQYIKIELPSMNTAILKVGNVDVSSYESASASLDRVAYAIAKISDMRTGFGTTQNRLEYAMSVDDKTSEDTQGAESRIRDADMAEEMVKYSVHSILAQCGESILAQTSRSLDSVLQLLE